MGFGVSRSVTMWSGRKPGLTCASVQTLRMSRVAPITSHTAIATSATTSAPRSRLETGTSDPRPLFKGSASDARDPCNAGTSPNAMPVRIASAPVKASTRQSIRTSESRGVSAGSVDCNSRRPCVARAMPSAPPRDASRTLSVSSCRMMRRRPAPSAERTAISRERPADRARVRLATFAHAISSTRATALSSISSRSRELATMSLWSGTTPTSSFHSAGIGHGNFFRTCV